MWNYYGSKSRVVDLYPRPKESKIIEPFAGSARYSLKYYENDILLVDAYDVIIKIWKYLQQCSRKDIIDLPALKTGMNLKDVHLADEERMFLGMLAGVASTSPRNKVSMFAAEQNGRINKIKNIADQLHKIRHWKFECKSYEEIPNQKATWFIDPPYKVGGSAYIKSKIDYEYLALWCKERTGQIIVCENTKADWLPFKPMTKMRGANMKYTTEAIYCNHETNYDLSQGVLL